MGKLKNGIFQNILAIAGLIAICIMVYFMYTKLIGFIGSVS
jgi:manganese transport protein